MRNREQDRRPLEAERQQGRVSATDPATLLDLALLMLLVCLGASFLPAGRITKVDLMVVLRCE